MAGFTPKPQQTQRNNSPKATLGTRSATLPPLSCHPTTCSSLHQGRTDLFSILAASRVGRGSRNTKIPLPRDNFSTNLHFCYCLPPFSDGHPGPPANSFCGAALPLFYPASSLTSLFCSHSTHFPNLCLVSPFIFVVFLIALNMSLYISQQQIYLNVSMLLLSRSECALPFQPPSESHAPLPRAPQNVFGSPGSLRKTKISLIVKACLGRLQEKQKKHLQKQPKRGILPKNPT